MSKKSILKDKLKKSFVRTLIDKHKEPHRIPYEYWANSQLSIAKHYGGCVLNGKTYTLDYENARKEGDKFFPDLVELIK